MTRTESLYREFLKNFPNFESMVVDYKKLGKNSIEITTRARKKFIFKKTNEGIDLRQA